MPQLSCLDVEAAHSEAVEMCNNNTITYIIIISDRSLMDSGTDLCFCFSREKHKHDVKCETITFTLIEYFVGCVPPQLRVPHSISFHFSGGGYKAAQDAGEAPGNMKYPTASFSLPFGLNNSLPKFLVCSSQTICGSLNAKSSVDVALGDACSSRRVGIKGELQAEGKVSRMERREGTAHPGRQF